MSFLRLGRKVVIATDFVESVLEKQGNNVGMCLDELDDVRIVRCFRHAHPFPRLPIDKRDSGVVAEDFGE